MHYQIYKLVLPLLTCLLLLPNFAFSKEIQLAAFVSEDVIEKTEAVLNQTASPIIVVESPYDFKTTIQNLKKAIAGRNFRLIRIQQLTQGFSEEDSSQQDTIVYFCNFNLVNQAIKTDFRIGQFLPCRVTVHEENGRVFLMATNPEPIGAMLGHKKLKAICSQISTMYRSLLEDATL
ncbi:MAG: DUF302 domain-containing protein [Gammaproteobacteria bacterium]|nr:DUF302 domain-containing protein [Gammaproteobacteria bacterium]